MRPNKQLPRTNQTVCPYSGTIADDNEFTHPDDVEAALEIVKHAAAQDVEEALTKILKDAFKGSSSGNGLVSITASVKRNAPKPKPHFTRQDLMRELVCDHCGRDYGVFAIGLFCPDCGAPNVRLHFAREAELVDDQVSLAEQIGIEKEELAYRLLGNAQLKASHDGVRGDLKDPLSLRNHKGWHEFPPPKVGNDFQNIDKSLQRFEELSLNPFDELTEPEMGALRLNIQKRHIIGHNLGVVDDKFSTHATDARVGREFISSAKISGSLPPLVRR